MSGSAAWDRATVRRRRGQVDDLQDRYRDCDLCPHECHVDRAAGERGKCGTDDTPKVGSFGPHRGEEPPLSGSGGSGTIFMGGCNLGCVFCQNWEHSQRNLGTKPRSPREIADLALVGGAIVLWLATLPDVDHRLPLVEHRGVTHTVPFALGVGGVLAAAAYATTSVLPFFDSPTVAAAFVGGLGAYGVLAHLLGDVLTPAGIPLLWPLSGRSYSLSLWTAKNPIANYVLLELGAFATAVTAVGVGAV